MAKFYKLAKIAEIRKETGDCVSISFDVPKDIKQEFNYIQGQYLTLKLNINGEEIRRSYSLCSSPATGEELRIAIKKVMNGKGSTWLNEKIKKGEEIEVMTPMGKFYSELSSSNKKNYILFAGGSGITPMMSIIKTTLISEPESKLTLFYGNRDEGSVIFRKELDELMKKNESRLKVYHILEQSSSPDEIFKGMLSSEKASILIEKYVDTNSADDFFICGPGPMMENVKQALHHLNIDKSKIHIEYFTASEEAASKLPEHKMPLIESKVKVILDGEEKVFSLAPTGDSILDAAINADMDVPFACKGAVCCTCKAKLIEGKVHMEMNYALSDEEVAAGYILTCQSHPLTPTVTVDYDQN